MSNRTQLAGMSRSALEQEILDLEARLREMVRAAQRVLDETAWQVRDAALENLRAALATTKSEHATKRIQYMEVDAPEVGCLKYRFCEADVLSGSEESH